jgi:hypothetical protein
MSGLSDLSAKRSFEADNPDGRTHPLKGVSGCPVSGSDPARERGAASFKWPIWPIDFRSPPTPRASVCIFFSPAAPFARSGRGQGGAARPWRSGLAPRGSGGRLGWRVGFGPNAPVRGLRGKLRIAKRWSAQLAWLLWVGGQIGAVALLTISFCSRASWRKPANQGAFYRHVASCRRLVEETVANRHQW